MPHHDKKRKSICNKEQGLMIYLDNASTTKPSKAAADACMKAIECFGNPSSLHRLGMEAEKLIKSSAETAAGILGHILEEVRVL